MTMQGQGRAVLLAAAFGAAAPAADAQTIERWLFLGRRADGAWHPPAVSIAQPPYPASPGGKVVVRRHALAYGAVDCKVLDAADFRANEQIAPALELVRAGEQGLEITGPAIECPSVCGAKTVWVNVRIPAARLIRIDH